jgi:hypothetical protein
MPYRHVGEVAELQAVAPDARPRFDRRGKEAGNIDQQIPWASLFEIVASNLSCGIEII